MKLGVLFAGFFLAFGATAICGNLTLAVVQYSDSRDEAAVAAAFAETNLAEVTNSDSIASKDAAIRGGSVLFSQTIPSTGQGSFSNTTRLNIFRSELKGAFSKGVLNASVNLEKGVDEGLRRFSRSVYQGKATLRGNTPTVLSVRS